jgi:hypothetical protein
MKMKKFIVITLLITVICLSSSVFASTYTISPADLVEQADFPTAIFGYDWDEGKPIGSTTTGPTGYENGSFWSDVQGSLAGDGRDYTAIRLNLATMAGNNVTVGDLEEVAFWTKLGDLSSIDWQAKIYTAEAQESDPGWYGHRINLYRPDNGNLDWNFNSSNTNMKVEWIRSGAGVSEYPTDTTLTDLDSSLKAETIMFVDIIAGFATDSPPVDSYIDGLEMTINGTTYTTNLVPEPATLALLGVGGLLLRRKK